jgi:septal ring factor EnvC (AmiA/AmiB activator)
LTKIDVTPIEEMHRHLCAEIATLREVNAAQAQQIAFWRAQADAYADNVDQMKDERQSLREQLRKAQERIRAAEACDVRAWNDALETAAVDLATVPPTTVSNDEKFWREYERGLCIPRIRSLAKEAGE